MVQTRQNEDMKWNENHILYNLISKLRMKHSALIKDNSFAERKVYSRIDIQSIQFQHAFSNMDRNIRLRNWSRSVWALDINSKL